MELPDKLVKRRIELKKNHSLLYIKKWTGTLLESALSTGFENGFNDGFKACYKELEPLIEALKIYQQGDTSACTCKACDALKKVGIE